MNELRLKLNSIQMDTVKSHKNTSIIHSIGNGTLPDTVHLQIAVTNNTRANSIKILKNNLKSYPNKVAVYCSTKYQISSFPILFLSNLSVSTMICNLWNQTMIWNPFSIQLSFPKIYPIFHSSYQWTTTWNPWNLYCISSMAIHLSICHLSSILVSWQQTIYWISSLPMMNPMICCLSSNHHSFWMTI